MKKSLFVVILMAMMFAVACNPQPAINQNATQNTNPKAVTTFPYPNAITLRYDVSKISDDEVKIIETCFDCLDGIPAVAIERNDKGIVISVLTLGIKFVGFAPTNKVSMIIQDFENITAPPTTAHTNPSLPSFPPANPFDPDASVTIVDPIKSTHSSSVNYHTHALTPHKAGTFKYAVVVEWTVSGKVRRVIMDPRVVFSDGGGLFK